MVMSFAQISPFVQGRFQYMLDSLGKRFNYKGITAAVLIPNQGIWKGTYGYSHDTLKISPEMAFGMGSNTKTFICALALKMQEQGLLNLNDSIGKWIVGYPKINKQATLRQCLNHTSGIAEYFSAQVNDSLLQKPEKIWTKPEILSMADTNAFAPGNGWLYSNSNYIIAGMIIETVLNKPIHEAMRQWLLDSANFNHTFFYGEQNNAPVPHQWTMNLGGGRLTDMNEFEVNLIPQLYSLATTAGAMLTTAEDNVKFWSALTSGKLLSAASWAEMTTWVPVNFNLSYGLGIFLNKRALNNRTYWSHGGTYLGFINENMVDTTSKIVISVLTNQDSLSNVHLANNIMKALHGVTLNMPPLNVNDTWRIQSLKITPNPATDNVWFDMDANGSKISLYDIQGRLMLTQSNSNTINVSEIPNGVYVVHILKDGAYYQQRLVVNHP